ncbi:hypothetical protein ILYODFUR_006241 [Ilyodon furcidens]|uniref:RIM zinc finger domain-containing protein n=1 Tax=Ilyodon furcidens TaxID=33524 RepID=A0ABV0UTE7_9TELE
MSAFNRSRTLHQQFESYKQEVRRIGVETRRQQTQQKDDAPTCGICRKTKFADGCGHLCSYCQTKFCARCGGRVSLRSNNDTTLLRLSLLWAPLQPKRERSSCLLYLNLGPPPSAWWHPICSVSTHPSWDWTHTGTIHTQA